MEKIKKLALRRVVRNIVAGILPMKTTVTLLEENNPAIGYSTVRDTAKGKRAEICLNPDHKMLDQADETKKYIISFGIAVHELLHIVYTDFEAFIASIKKITEPAKRRIFKTMFNIIEDSFIEDESHVLEVLGGIAPQYLLEAKKYTFETSEPIDTAVDPVQQLIGALIQYGDVGKVKGDFMSDEVRDDFIYLADLHDQAVMERKCSERLKIAEKMADYLMDKYGQSSPMPEMNDLVSTSGKGRDAQSDPSQSSQNKKQKFKEKLSKKSFSEKPEESEENGCSDEFSEDEIDYEPDDNTEGNFDNESESFENENNDNGSEENEAASGDDSEDEKEYGSGEEESEGELTPAETEELEKMLEEAVNESINKAIEQLENEMKNGSKSTFPIKEDPEATYGVLTEIPIVEEDFEAYDTFADAYDVVARGKALATALTPIFKSKNKGKAASNVGKINLKRVTNGKVTPYIFDKRSEKVNDASVLILIDQSGSMSGDNMNEAKAMASEMCEAFKKLDIPFAVCAHSAQDEGFYSGDMQMRVYKDFKAKYWQNIGSMTAYACNYDGAAIRTATGIIKPRAEKNKVLIVITDGLSHNVENCAKAVAEAKRIATVIGVSLCVDEEDVSRMNEMYGSANHIICKKVSDFNPLLTAKLKELARTW